MNPMNPLLQTLQVGDTEEQLVQLFNQLYLENLAELDDEINVYGAPHLGPLSLIQRALTGDGLSVLNLTDDDGMRYLYKAWRHRNPKRGMHFLKKYLQILFGSVWDVSQLWQKKSAAYPEGCKSLAEIALDGEAIEAFYMTSRVRVDVATSEVPERVLRALLSTVAARIVLEVRVTRAFRSTYVAAPTFFPITLCYVAGELIDDKLPDGALALGGAVIVSGGQRVVASS